MHVGWGCLWCVWGGGVCGACEVGFFVVHVGWGVVYGVYDGAHIGKGRIVREECVSCGNGRSMRRANVVWICRACDVAWV